MEIEKDVIRLSPEDINTFVLYIEEVDDPETQDFIAGLHARLMELEADANFAVDNIRPIVEVPFSKKVTDLYAAALKNRQEKDERITEKQDSEAERLSKARGILARRPGFLNGTIVRLEDRRRR